MAATPPVCEFGWEAVDFSLPSTDGARVGLADIQGARGTLVMFICNHCPYVLSVLNQIIGDARDLQALGIGVVAISSNDAGSYPQDGPKHMASLARDHEFPFPYLYDESQETARAYDAACTPDFFGFNAVGELQYRGRLVAPDGRRELFEALRTIAETGAGPREQVPSMGCSIKWKTE